MLEDRASSAWDVPLQEKGNSKLYTGSEKLLPQSKARHLPSQPLAQTGHMSGISPLLCLEARSCIVGVQPGPENWFSEACGSWFFPSVLILHLLLAKHCCGHWVNTAVSKAKPPALRDLASWQETPCLFQHQLSVLRVLACYSPIRRAAGLCAGLLQQPLLERFSHYFESLCIS